MGPETLRYIEVQSEIITKVIFDFPLHLPLHDVIQRGGLVKFPCDPTWLISSQLSPKKIRPCLFQLIKPDWVAFLMQLFCPG